ncbi:arginine--tRNA ligase [Jeotgalibacillus sp. R-1-5s-1]|uniref:arginine--tRNA ligase n=1 Tax=Jeotgalibacillus sp. R-1-5s-1 TaxID=2555897 RepID=UPI00106C2864|nr:arginine--tRNA ligase [Jeotgalibacillus sp. R-1-5s-1]TFD99985.1 arginine--tRNA ligase [Jeotgalibacillus sp. R-1-5s-1]
MLMKQHIAQALKEQLPPHLAEHDIEQLLEAPRFQEQGDLAFPCFRPAKALRRNPAQIAAELAESFTCSGVQEVKAIGGYVNFYFHIPTQAESVLSEILAKGADYGTAASKGEIIAIDFSSPNIAKPFSMGHLRSTVIGQSMSLISAKSGYQVEKINHLGDWGTQFGKLMAAYTHWGNEELVKADPITELHKLYVRFHDEATNNENLNEQGRSWFKMLEDGDEKAVRLWTWFRDVSLDAFEQIYELMGVSFDSYQGEAFYNDKMHEVVEKLDEAGLLEESDGARVVRLDELNLPPCLIQKSDGATLYATRDLAAAYYRVNTLKADKLFYVVGNEQSLHFKQLKEVLKRLGENWADELTHIPFGMMLKDGKKMSTRKGKVVLLENVLKESIELAAKTIEEKNPSLPNKEKVAKQVGIGAVFFHDLKVFRQNDVEFSLENMLRFEGETGPYVQYTHARASAILRKAEGQSTAEAFSSFGEAERPLVQLLAAFPDKIAQAFDQLDPSIIAKYVVQTAQAFNQYYAHEAILNHEHSAERLALVKAVVTVLDEGLRLLGLEAPEEM